MVHLRLVGARHAAAGEGGEVTSPERQALLSEARACILMLEEEAPNCEWQGGEEIVTHDDAVIAGAHMIRRLAEALDGSP